MDKNCRAFQFKGSRPENCLFIHKISADAVGQVFKTNNVNTVYEISMIFVLNILLFPHISINHLNFSSTKLVGLTYTSRLCQRQFFRWFLKIVHDLQFVVTTVCSDDLHCFDLMERNVKH